MRKALNKVLIVVGGALFCGMPAVADAKIEGQCSDCHTMHNSEQGEEVTGLDGDSREPNPALLRMDCIGCHAQGTGERIVTMGGGSLVPQVYHTDSVADLAAGNFAYISGTKSGVDGPGSRKGHDLLDFGFQDDILTYPPGFRHSDNPNRFRAENFTCAGVNGCHGWRNQLMEDDLDHKVPRTGLAAIMGAHHGNEDGQLTQAEAVADSYRFLVGLYGLENPDPNNRWQNASADSHNEYYGVSNQPFGARDDQDCTKCHVGSPDATTSSYITTPNNSMSGFCSTCHSDFHSTGAAGTMAFLRHPSDFVIKDDGEYAKYTSYELTAPVARPEVPPASSNAVRPGTDLVMCLSCHLAHAGPHDGMLRFDYAGIAAGNAEEGNRKGCLACHTSK